MPAPPLKAVVPAAGMGTRMRPLTYACPKELLPVGAKPVIHRIMDELAASEIEEVCIITSAEKPSLEAYLRAIDFPLNLSFVNQESPRGLGDALLYSRDFAGDSPIAVALGDSLIESEDECPPLARMVNLHQATGAGVILCQKVPVERISRYGVLDPLAGAEALEDESFLLRGAVEKPPAEEAPSPYAVTARYILPNSIYDALERTPPGHKGELVLTDAISLSIEEGEAFYGLRLREGERRWDIGGFNTYFDAFMTYAAYDRAEMGERPS